MSDYLTDGWPLGHTSTVYMSGQSVYDVREYGKPGVLARPVLSGDEAQIIRDVVEHRINQAKAEALAAFAEEIRDFPGEDTLRNHIANLARTRAEELDPS